MSQPEPAALLLATKPEAPAVTPERPGWGVYEGWVQNEKGRRLKPGVYWHNTKLDDEGERHLVDEWIASPVFVIARTVNTDDGSEGRLLRLVTHGSNKEWVLPMEVFGGSGEDARRSLFAMGVLIALRKRGAFMEYLLEQQPRQTIATTSRPGWHESGVFVIPGRIIGGEGVRYQANSKVMNQGLAGAIDKHRIFYQLIEARLRQARQQLFFVDGFGQLFSKAAQASKCTARIDVQYRLGEAGQVRQQLVARAKELEVD